MVTSEKNMAHWLCVLFILAASFSGFTAYADVERQTIYLTIYYPDDNPAYAAMGRRGRVVTGLEGIHETHVEQAARPSHSY